MSAMNALVEQYRHRAVFAFVYIQEAHAVDEWPVRSINADVRQHRSLEDRTAAARRLQAEFPLHAQMHLLLDNEHNDFNCTYSVRFCTYYFTERHTAAEICGPESTAAEHSLQVRCCS